MAAGKDVICNVCNSIKEGQIITCKEPSTYFSTNCTKLITYLKYCVILNGNYTVVESSGKTHQAIWLIWVVWSSLIWVCCQFDLDKYEVFTKDLKPGCVKRYIDKARAHYLAYAYFHFDGEICLCNDEDNCNSGDTWIPKLEHEAQNPGKNSAMINTIFHPVPTSNRPLSASQLGVWLIT